MDDKTDSALDVMDAMTFRLEDPEDGAKLQRARYDVAELLRVAEQIDDKYVHGEGTDEEVEEWNSAIRAMRGDV